MAQQTINAPAQTHSPPRTNTQTSENGDSYRETITKVNAMFTELYNYLLGTTGIGAALKFLAGNSTTGLFGSEGNLSKQTSAAGVGNAADATDDTLFTYTLPANAFDGAGRAVTITAYGRFSANGNSKRVKIWFGATVVADSGALAGNNVGWQLQADVAKTGAGGSNTQIAQGQAIVGTAHGGVNVPPVPAETESGAIVIKVTGSSAASAANDVLGNFFQVNFQN